MLEQLKKEVLEIAKRAQRDGLCKHKSGNFSARDKDTGFVAITPAGADRELLTVRDMIILDLDANVLENESGLKPTSESLMHLMIYKTRPDVMAVAHTHSMYATSFAVLAKPIPAIVYETAILGLKNAVVPVAKYGRPGTTELADSVVGPISEADCFLMEKHGIVAVDGRDVYEAFLKAAYVEELAELYYHTLLINNFKEPPAFAPEELQKWEYPKEIKFKGGSAQ